METMIRTLFAPAKINLRLDVLGKREDGYHEIDSLMTRVSIFDEISLKIDDGDGIEVITDGPAPSGEDNIAYKAVRLLLDTIQRQVKVRVSIKKKIPVAAGLGGGSSNAASVLMGVNKMLCAGLSTMELMKIGASLGADVPFFILESAAIARGIGEKLEVATVPHMWLVLVNPNIPVSTADVYKGLNLKIGLTKGPLGYSMSSFRSSIDEIVGLLHNDLEDVALRMHPQIGSVKDAIRSRGAAGVLMSGSGSTVFGIFNDRKKAEEAYLSLTAREKGWRVFLAESI